MVEALDVVEALVQSAWREALQTLPEVDATRSFTQAGGGAGDDWKIQRGRDAVGEGDPWTCMCRFVDAAGSCLVGACWSATYVNSEGTSAHFALLRPCRNLKKCPAPVLHHCPSSDRRLSSAHAAGLAAAAPVAEGGRGASSLRRGAGGRGEIARGSGGALPEMAEAEAGGRRDGPFE